MAALRALPARSGHFDELRHGDGLLRAPWAAFFSHLGAAGLADLERRAITVARSIRDDGVTYNVYGDEGGGSRPWSLDLLPLLIAPDEWAHIAAGVAQRAALCSRILHDVYGGGALLRDGLLPPALVLGHPGYLRPLVGSHPVGGLYLYVVAFDLARDPTGRWAVVMQRTGAPSGLGYALQNRMIVGRLFPEAFRGMRIQRLASSYKRLLDTMFRLAPRIPGESGPIRAVLLTPGPYNETYFEHAYLARYLGIALVEGTDLMVRDDRVYLKTLRGLEPVHAILRRLDDDFCDPLELRSDSTLGVPGLLQAIRAGRVLVANALGTGFLESPALNGFLPAIAQRLLGESLSLASLDTWWCGERALLDQVLSQLPQRILKPTYPAGAGRLPFDAIAAGRGVSGKPMDVDDLARRIHADPDAFTAQAWEPFSQMPCWQHGTIVPRTAMLRVYAIADGQGGWHAMPGGLTRMSADDQQRVSMQAGGSSADTWVMTEGVVDGFSMLPEARQTGAVVSRRPLTSRVAENLFWMGRYTERTEHSVRLTRATLGLLNDDLLGPAALLQALSRLCTLQGLVPWGAISAALSPTVFERTMLSALANDRERAGIAYSLDALTRSGGQIRDRLSTEHWRLIVDAAAQFRADCEVALAEGVFSSNEATAALSRVAVSMAAITGAQCDRMTRDDGWRLLSIGRHLERLTALTEALTTVFDSPLAAQIGGLELLLALFDSTITYRALYQRQADREPLLDLVVSEMGNPRALACVTAELWIQLEALLSATHDRGIEFELRQFLPRPIHWPTLAQLCEDDDAGRPVVLLALCERLCKGAARVSNLISTRYFSHAEPAFQSLAS